MTDLFVSFDLDTVTPDREAPAPEKVLSGDPQFTTWLFEATDGETLFSGVWEATPGKWRISYAEWEFCSILSGRSIVTGADGDARDLKAGDSFILRPGFEGTWEVLETTRKLFVVRL